MRLLVTSWNINSVRLRLPQVLRFLDEVKPDVLCLQETKCPDDAFPWAELRKRGYGHGAIHGQKGYHGVATLSRLPLTPLAKHDWCAKGDARHISARLASGAGAAEGITIHNFYVPAGGDIADPAENPKFAHKLTFIDELTKWGESGHQSGERPAAGPAILVGDLNIAPYEHDVWSHKKLLNVVSHTPIETEGLERARTAGDWTDAVRTIVPLPTKLYTWWSYRSPDWDVADKGRRLDHAWVSPPLKDKINAAQVHRDIRGWERPSDHAPLTITLTL
jgi:exodeoxyribonuclease III